MNKTLEAVAIACIKECERQQVGLHQLGQLIEAVAYGIDNASRLPREGDVLHMALLIEPSTGGAYRRTPVTFQDGGSASDWRDVPGATARLMAHVDYDVDAKDVAKAFLAIHPFTDGNGRLAFVLLNWIQDTLTDPSPLPDFFNEERNP